ncbi:MAG: rhamnulokinase, partial [Cryptosporangiaceae bacterium]|nr:rhamnulokinase [Cryptosporangiaceae bacterium]
TGSAGRPVSLAAVDLGASSGRVVLGRIGAGVLDVREVHRFRNGPVALTGGLYWDVLGLYQDTLTGLRRALREDPGLAGIAVDSWAVDYGLLAEDGALLGNPRHYRDPRTEAAIGTVHALADPAELYATTGIQFQPFNTLYQLAAEPHLDRAARALLIPDLFGYWLTGIEAAEQTNASTTGLLDARGGEWSRPLLSRLGVPGGLLAEVVPAGTVLGPVTAGIRGEVGAGQDLVVTTAGSHDTASAVAGVPARGPRFGYVSCGTWGLVGVELTAPVLTEASRLANFTNERGIDGTIRYLRNVMGLWLLSECQRTWALRGIDVDLAEALELAARLPAGGPRFGPGDPVFLPPGDMPERIARACREAGQPVPATIPEYVRCILDSLATAFAAAITEAEQLSGQPVDVVHLVGGGSQNALLCQLVADACGREVIAGPAEATAIGNLLVQARTHGALAGDLWDLRARLRDALPLAAYHPRDSPHRIRTSAGLRRPAEEDTCASP